MKIKLVIAAVVAVASVGTLNVATGQDGQNEHRTRQYQIQQPDQQFQQQIIVTPKLGIHAFDDYGYVEITSVFFNTPAKRLGLEPGDRILQVNGRRIRSLVDLQRSLRQAANFHGGQIRVLVDNVRARHGQPVERYVSVATYLGGYGPVYTPAPVYSQQQ